MRVLLVAWIVAGSVGRVFLSVRSEGSGCAVPGYLLATENALHKVGDAIKRKRLDILVVGSGSSALAGSDGVNASYPARLEAALRDKACRV